MRLIFIFGLPASGKLTIARELAAATGYRLFHNHLAVDLLLAVFEFGSPSFVELREEIWLKVIDHAARAQLPGLIFTFAPEKTVRPDFVPALVGKVQACGGQVDFVELVCPLTELPRRLADPSRSRHGKLTSIELFEQLRAEGTFDSGSLPQATLTIDTSLSSAAEAAARISAALALHKTAPQSPS